MFGPNVAVREPLRFFRGIGEHALALIAQWKIYRGRNLFSNGSVTLDLLADGLYRGVRAQESTSEGFIFGQEPQQQVLGLYIRRPDLACFVLREENPEHAFLRIALKHNAPALCTLPANK